MNIITAIDDEKILKKIKEANNINIICNDIKYKEGIIEYLEKNKKIDYIIINENLNGQIKIEILIQKIKNINNKINIIIILNKKDMIKEEYLIKNKIKFILKENILEKNIREIILNKNKIIGILGYYGSGKTITTIIVSELLIKYYDKKILIVADNIKNNSILKIYKKDKEKNKVIYIKENLDILNIKKIIINNYKKEKIKIIKEINKIKDNYDCIFIDTQNFNSLKIYSEILEEKILLLNSNIIEINKIKKYIIKNSDEIKIILNNYNENSLSEEIIKNIFKNKIKIIGKIKNNNRYNLIINNKFNIKYLGTKDKNNFLKIIKEI